LLKNLHVGAFNLQYYSLMTQIYLYLTNHFMEWLLKQMSS